MSEHYFSGYCRQLDTARMVELVVEGSAVDEIDCCYGDCAFQSTCPIAQQIDTLLEK